MKSRINIRLNQNLVTGEMHGALAGTGLGAGIGAACGNPGVAAAIGVVSGLWRWRLIWSGLWGRKLVFEVVGDGGQRHKDGNADHHTKQRHEAANLISKEVVGDDLDT